MTTDTDNAESQAEAPMESIVAMVERYQHAQQFSCDAFDCDAPDEEIVDGLVYAYSGGCTSEQREEYNDAEKASTMLDEDPLSVQVRSAWYTPGSEGEDLDNAPAEFTILLCTGGPAVRIMGELDEHGDPHRAWIEYQDWGTPWTQYFDASQATLLSYAQHFLYAM